MRSNLYPQNCRQCGNLVPAGSGELSGSAGRWVVSHKMGECLPPATVVVVVEPALGAYVLADGRGLRVERGRQNRKIQGFTWSPRGDSGSWTYTGQRLFGQILRPMTADEAHTFGRLTRHCVYCGLYLQTPESVGAGYGPVCAKNHGLPWGKATAQLATVPTATARALLGEPATLADA